MANSLKTEKNGIKNFNDIVMKCFRTLKRHKGVQEGRMEYFKKKGDQHFTKNGREAKITSDLALQARAKMSENKVDGPEDAVVSEMSKTVIIAKYLQERSLRKVEAPSSWKIVKLVFFFPKPRH